MRKLGSFVISWFLIGSSVGLAHPPQDLVEQALQAYNARDFTRAQEILLRVVQQDPSARNFSLLGMSESAAGKLDQAITHFQQSIRLGNGSASVHYNLGMSYLLAHHTALGTREIQRALSIDPKLEPARYNLAVALVDAGRSEEALPYLLHLRDASPCDAAIWANLVRAQFEAENTEDAFRTIDKARHDMVHNVSLLVTMASLCSRYRQPQKARYLLESADELKPDDPDIKLRLAKASIDANEPAEALAVLKDVPASGGAPGAISYTRGLALELSGREEAAEAELSAAVEADPESIRYLIALAWLYQLRDQQEKALSVLQKARERDPQSAVAPFRMAISAFLLGRYDQAKQYCKEAIRIAPHYHAAYLLSGVADLEVGNPNEAAKAIQQAIQLAPTTALYHREMGVVLFRNGQFPESKKELDQAVRLDPKAAQAYFWRARSFERLGDQEAAVRDLETTVALQPDNREAYSELAPAYAKVGQTQKAEDALNKEKALKATPRRRRDFLAELADPLL